MSKFAIPAIAAACKQVKGSVPFIAFQGILFQLLPLFRLTFEEVLDELSW
jgi:hypothetical protein